MAYFFKLFRSRKTLFLIYPTINKIQAVFEDSVENKEHSLKTGKKILVYYLQIP